METQGIQVVIQRMLHVEEEARDAVSKAEHEAKEIVAKARDEARGLEDTARRGAHEKVQKGLEDAVRSAQDQRKSRIEQVMSEDAAAIERCRRNVPHAVSLAAKLLAGG